MPTSSPVVITEVINLVGQAPHTAVLDVGPGYGKYGVMIREYMNEKPARLDAIEAHAPYVEQFPWLDCIYDEVLIGDVTELGSEYLQQYDLVLMCDVLEHLQRDAAIELLLRIPGRVVICTPRDFFDNGPGLPATEAHVSHWPAEEIESVCRTMGRAIEVLYTNEVGAVLARLAPR